MSYPFSENHDDIFTRSLVEFYILFLPEAVFPEHGTAGPSDTVSWESSGCTRQLTTLLKIKPVVVRLDANLDQRVKIIHGWSSGEGRSGLHNLTRSGASPEAPVSPAVAVRSTVPTCRQKVQRCFMLIYTIRRGAKVRIQFELANSMLLY